jgi:hypothetical protein
LDNGIMAWAEVEGWVEAEWVEAAWAEAAWAAMEVEWEEVSQVKS